MVTIKDIATNSGYSPATVSRLLKGDKSLSIAEETKHKIIQTALGLGYDRSKIKTTLEKILFIFWIDETEEFEDIYFHNLKTSLVKYAELNSMDMSTLTKEDSFDSIPDDIGGVVAVGRFTRLQVKELHQRCPNGVILEINPEPDLFDTVKPDTDRMTQKAIDFFLQKKYEKIGFIGGGFLDPETNTFKQDTREYTFRMQLERFGILDESLIFAQGPFTVQQGYRLAKQLLQHPDSLPKGIFIASDTLAVGVLQAFNEENIQVPQQIEIISINDNDIAKYISPPLSTFRIDADEIAKTAIDSLVDQILYPRKTTKTVLLNSEFIERRSFQL